MPELSPVLPRRLSRTMAQAQPKELCSLCKKQPFDVACQCGEKFDFKCITKHMDDVATKYATLHQQTGRQILSLSSGSVSNGFHSEENIIDEWERSRTRLISEIAAAYKARLHQSLTNSDSLSAVQEEYDAIDQTPSHSVHDKLILIEDLSKYIKTIEAELSEKQTLTCDLTALDTELREKLNVDSSTTERKSSSNYTRSPALENGFDSYHEPRSSTDDRTSNSLRCSNDSMNTTTANGDFDDDRMIRSAADPIRSTHSSADLGTKILSDTSPSRSANSSAPETATAREAASGPSRPETVPDSQNDDDAGNDQSDDEFDPGLTSRIQSRHIATVQVRRDPHASALCCHDNSLLYVDNGESIGTRKIVFIRDINNLDKKELISWDPAEKDGETATIRDLVYSTNLHMFLLLTRTSIYKVNIDRCVLEKFYPSRSCLLYRLICNNNYLYLVTNTNVMSPHYDQVILMNYEKEEVAQKQLRDLVPARVTRGVGLRDGDITDIAVNFKSQLAVGYRIDRRQEIGICLFNISNNGKDWSSVKQLLLNECWNNTLRFTPRMEWCEKLSSFILVEYMTGHLILIAPDGTIPGECRIVKKSTGDAPVNISVSNNDLLCTRYDSFISIKKID